MSVNKTLNKVIWKHYQRICEVIAEICKHITDYWMSEVYHMFPPSEETHILNSFEMVFSYTIV